MKQKPAFHRYMLIVFLLSTTLLCLCGLSGCSIPANVDSPKAKASQDAFSHFLREQFCDSFEDELIHLHYTLKNPENFGIERPDKASSDISLDSPADTKEDLLQMQKELHQINKNHLPEDLKRIYQTLDTYLKQQIALCDYPEFLNLLSYASGISSNIPITLAEYAFYTEEDIKDYLSILTQIPILLAQALEWEQHQTASGYGMSAFEIDHTITQIDLLLSDEETMDNSSSLLIDTFASRLDSVPGLSTDQKKSYIQNNINIVKKTVLPSFLELKTGLMELKKTSPEGKGLYYYENGLEYYELLLASTTLSDQSLSSMIRTLENRLTYLTESISKVVSQTPEIYDVFFAITEENILPAQTPAEMLHFLEEQIYADYPELSEITYRAEPIPEALKNDTTAAYYLIPPYDSPEENRIYYGDSSTDNASLFMVLAHEGYPGHLYHQNYLLEHGLNPIFYVIDITGYKEGWAFYAELDAADCYDYGKYDSEYHDELTELYRCNAEYSYCISSLVDLYVNGKGYSKENIAEFITDLGMDEGTALSLYQYAIEEPCTYLQYYIGYLEILHIRNTAEKNAGNKFNKKDFHQAFLSLGPCYYKDLAKYMNENY